MKAFRNALPFLSFKGLAHTYLVKLPINYNKAEVDSEYALLIE